MTTKTRADPGIGDAPIVESVDNRATMIYSPVFIVMPWVAAMKVTATGK